MRCILCWVFYYGGIMPAASSRYSSPNNNSKGVNVNTNRLKLISLLIGGVVSLFIIIGVGRGLVETNNAGFYQIKQAAVTGTMTVIDNPGSYLRLFGDVTT